MNIPYTYVITAPNGQRYYGVRYAKNCHPSDLWVTYFTSSKHVKKLILENNINDFKFEIRKIFTNTEDALNWEERVLTKLKVKSNQNWINVTNSRGWKSMKGDLNPSKREDVKLKISLANKGKLRPDQSKRLKENHHMKDPEIAKKTSNTRKQKFITGELVSLTKGQKRPEISGELHPRFGKIYKALSDANKQEHTCPICNKVGKGPGMKRYHFDNCKFK